MFDPVLRPVKDQLLGTFLPTFDHATNVVLIGGEFTVKWVFIGASGSVLLDTPSPRFLTNDGCYY